LKKNTYKKDFQWRRFVKIDKKNEAINRDKYKTAFLRKRKKLKLHRLEEKKTLLKKGGDTRKR